MQQHQFNCKKNHDLTNALPNEDPWKTVQPCRRDVKSQPTDSNNDILLQTILGNFNSSEAECTQRRQYIPRTDLSKSTIRSTDNAIKENKEKKKTDDKERPERVETREPEDNDVTRDHIITETFTQNKLIIGLNTATLPSNT